MDVQHPLIAGSRNDDKTIPFLVLKPRLSLCKGAEEHRLLGFQANEIGLFFLRVIGVFDPLKPALAWNQSTPIRPERFEELPRRDSFNPRIDGGGAFSLRPKW